MRDAVYRTRETVTGSTDGDEDVRGLEAGVAERTLDALGDVFYVLGTDREIRRGNARAAEVTGYSDDQLSGMDTVELFPEEDRREIADAIGRARRTGDAVVESELLTADGDRLPYEFTGVRLTDAGDGPIGLVGVGREDAGHGQYQRRLTALHDVADALAASESVEAVCDRTIDASREILEFDMSLITIEDGGVLSPVAVSEDVSPEGLAEMPVDEGIAGKTYRTGNSFLIDDIEASPDANPQGPYRSGLSVALGDHGNFQAVSETTDAFDETDLELAELLLRHTENALDRLAHERRLERQNERLEEFASAVSHDLRNPLNVAEGRLELAREDCESEHLAAATDAVERSRSLIDDVLVLAREGRRVGEPTSIELATLAEDCWTNVETPDATVVVESERTIRADPSRLKHLLENLFRNAVEHGGSDVTVTIGDAAEGFYVADDGHGIPEADRDRVFESGYSTTGEGTGLGLDIVREVAEAHGWDVRVGESEEGGARFEFTDVE
jgi:PAS domain S-box-containing protein